MMLVSVYSSKRYDNILARYIEETHFLFLYSFFVAVNTDLTISHDELLPSVTTTSTN